MPEIILVVIAVIALVGVAVCLVIQARGGSERTWPGVTPVRSRQRHLQNRSDG